MQSYSSEIPRPQYHQCECYKKLEAFGIPLYIEEENDLYTESQRVVQYENAFQLPGFLKVANVSNYPVVEESELSLVFEQMAQILPALADFEQNVLSFWILDIFIEGLWTAQNAKLNQSHQKATLLWIAYFFNYIQDQNPSRRELFHHLKTVLFCPDMSGESFGLKVINSLESVRKESEDSDSISPVTTWNLPLPPDVYGNFNDSRSSSSEFQNSSKSEEKEEEVNSFVSSPSEVKREGESIKEDTKTNLENMKLILEILYRIFARLWVFLEIQTVFHAMPPVEQVNLPFTLNVPKPLYRPEPTISVKAERSGKRQSFSEKSLEETEAERQSHRNDYILPLQAAEESKFYVKQIFGQATSDRSVFNKTKEERTKK